jgi:ribosomal protein S18 acetylase RimI-like enzyme
MHTVRAARIGEMHAVLDVLKLAFSSDPAMRWTFPRAEDYVRWQAPFMLGMAGRAFEHGTAFVTEDLGAAALWLPPGVAGEGDLLTPIFERAVPPEKRETGGEVGALMAEHHPAEPHWYLPLIGVDPAHQGRGFGSALLKHGLAICDQQNLPAYLESSNPRNTPLYRRHGFDVTGEIRPGGFPGLTPMLRPARPG